MRVYVGEVEGQPVPTGMSITLGDQVGVSNVATVAAHRRRGYGGAVTARLISDAFAAGGRLACLQSSPEGLGVYGQLGLRTVEMWPCWVVPA